MAMLEIKNLEVYYGMIQAIKGISFEVNEGEVIALIGANGAGSRGKTGGKTIRRGRLCRQYRLYCSRSSQRICHGQRHRNKRHNPKCCF